MGIPANIKGFKYIVDIMVLFENNTEVYYGKITSLYVKVAEDNNSTASRVERAIRHAFGIAISKANTNAVHKYFTSVSNTTNGNLLHVLYLRLTQSE